MFTTKMTKIGAAIASSFIIVSVANAATPGAYAGIGLGASNINASLKSDNSDPVFPINMKTTSGGVGGKLFGGYNFNQYFGLEGNFATYAPTKNTQTVLGANLGTIKYSMQAVSLVGKAYFPIQQTFNLYALGGVSEVYSTVKASGNSVDITTNNGNDEFIGGGITSTTKTHKLRPVYGVGASYDVNSHVNAGLEFSHIQGSGNINNSLKAIPSANMLTLNGAYNFG